MLGAIAGDIIGSIYEGRQPRRIDFPLFQPGCRFTDDSVLTVAVADAILTQTPYVNKYKDYFHLYPDIGYGDAFWRWANSASMEPYNSFGNGSAMRVSPVGWAFDDLENVLLEAAVSAECTHNHPEGVKGAQAVAAAIFFARGGYDKAVIRREIETRFGYDLSSSVQSFHDDYQFAVTCQGTVPRAVIAFLESQDFESAVRNAVYIGGDSDTTACVTGSIAEAFYGGVPTGIRGRVYKALDARLTRVVGEFTAKYGPGSEA